MKEHQLKLFLNGMNKIMERASENDLGRAGKAAATLGAILITWSRNGHTKVYKKNGEIKKKYQKSK